MSRKESSYTLWEPPKQRPYTFFVRREKYLSFLMIV